MDAPQGRYRVVEKDGRLIVIDNETGTPIPSSVAPPPPVPPGRPGASSSGPVASAGPGAVDRAADFLLAVAVREWDSQGRAVIAWEWRENGKVRRWDAALDGGQQRRLGRALLALVALPVFLVLSFLVDGALFALALLFALPFAAWAMISVRRLYGETNDPRRSP